MVSDLPIDAISAALTPSRAQTALLLLYRKSYCRSSSSVSPYGFLYLVWRIFHCSARPAPPLALFLLFPSSLGLCFTHAPSGTRGTRNGNACPAILLTLGGLSTVAIELSCLLLPLCYIHVDPAAQRLSAPSAVALHGLHRAPSSYG